MIYTLEIGWGLTMDNVWRFHCSLSLILQPLEAELNDTSEQVRKASKEVAELQEAVLLEKRKGELCEDVLIEPVKAVPSAVSKDMLINLVTPSPPPCDQSHDLSCDSQSLTNPSLDMLDARADMLVPEKLDNTPLTNHKPEPSSQYLSQELF